MASHFTVAEVQMKPLNDPLPPHHTASPQNNISEAIPYYNLDLSQVKKVSTTTNENKNTIPASSLPEYGSNYPSVSHGK